MLRNNLIAIALLAASTGVMASPHDRVYSRVVSVEPHFVFSIGSGNHHDGFRIQYEVGGQHYWTHSQHRPGHAIWVPRPAGHVIHHQKRHWDYRHHDRHHDRRHDGRDDRRSRDRHDRDGYRSSHDRY